MLSLADLRARNVRPVWQEAVAVVQELVQGALSAGGTLPDLEHVTLIPNGDVVALPGSAEPGNPVRHSAAMLSALLDGTAVPPELGQFVKRNTAESPQCQGLEDFARNLSFFERPGRRADVERLVERAMAAEQNTRADDELQRLKDRALEATVAMQSPPDLFATPERRRSPVPALLLALVLLIVVIGLPVWWWRTRAVAPQTPAPVADAASATAAAPPLATAGAPGSQPAATTPAAGTPGVAATPAASIPAAGTPGAPAGAAASTATSSPAPQPSLLERTTAAVKSAVDRLVTAASPTHVVPLPKSEETPAPATRHANRRKPPVKAAPPEVPDADLRPSAADRAPAATAPAVTSVEPKMEDVPPPPVDETIYSASDAAVIAPILVRPVLPKDPPPGVAADQIGTMEVLVDEQGDVERVKLISPGNRFHERMLVSAAKMWKFRPAFREGRPVRYLAKIRLTI
jgi:hypothetical protein